MAGFDTEKSGLPMLMEASRPRPSLKRSSNTAAFISQLLAARHIQISQPTRGRTTTENAIGAYSNGAKIAHRRMPMGYRTTILA